MLITHFFSFFQIVDPTGFPPTDFPQHAHDPTNIKLSVFVCRLAARMCRQAMHMILGSSRTSYACGLLKIVTIMQPTIQDQS